MHHVAMNTQVPFACLSVPQSNSYSHYNFLMTNHGRKRERTYLDNVV